MQSSQQSDRETYRAIVLGPVGTEVLVLRTVDGLLLPSVEIPRWQRVAENLTAAVSHEWGCSAVSLFTLDDPVLTRSSNGNSYQVMELSGPVAKPHLQAKWVQIASLSENAFMESADFAAVHQSIAECTEHSKDAARRPFARLGWFRELQTWVEGAVSPLGLHLNGRFSQLNASPSFSLVRFETNKSGVWFKAVGEPNLREFSITLELARLFPQYVPQILGTRLGWNGWLALEVDGANLDGQNTFQPWKSAAEALAKLQSDSVGEIRALVDAGVREVPYFALSELIRPFFSVMGLLMEEQTEIPPAVLSKRELLSLAEQVGEALSLLEGLRLPAALGSFDLNPGNIIVSDSQCVFLDWAEAFVGHPFLSFQYLIEHFRRTSGHDESAEQDLTRAYCQPWQSFVSGDSLQEAMALARLLAVFAYAAAIDLWRDEARLRDPKVAAYFRSLTRRMHREAHWLRDRSALCPN